MDLKYMCCNCGAEMNISDNDLLNLEQTTGLFQKRLQCAVCSAFITIPDARLANNAEISGYRIISRIEVDGFHEIYVAEHLQSHQMREIQVLHSPFDANGDAAQLFLTAMNRYMRLNHPNLIKILDAGQSSEGIYFVAWQKVDSTSLGNRLWEGGALELKPALHLATVIAQVLEWLWTQHGLIYGSLSPRHIWIAPDNSVLLFNTILTPLVKDQLPTFPVETMMTGIPGFMSPEMLKGAPQLDCRHDIYALGATLYNMLTGSPPFLGLNPQQIQESQERSSLPDPRTLRPDLPASVVEFLKSTLAYHPEDRPKDWPTLLGQLANLQKDKPIPQPPTMSHHSVLIELEPSMVPPPSKKIIFVKPSRNPITMVVPPPAKTESSRAFHGILIGGLIAVVAFIMWFAMTPNPAPLPARPAKQSQATATALPAATSLPPPSAPIPSNTVARVLPPVDAFEALYKTTQQHLKNNPADYAGLLKQYDALLAMTETIKPSWRTRILEERRGVEMTQSFALERATEEIQNQSAEFTKTGRYEEGIAWLTRYQGVFSNQTSELRGRLCSDLAQLAKTKNEISRAKQQGEKVAQNNELTAQRGVFLATLSKAVLENNLELACQTVQKWNEPRDLAWPKSKQDELLQQLDLLNKLPLKITECYKELIGKTVKIELVSGTMNGKLIGVADQEFTIQPYSADGEVITVPVPFAKVRPNDVLQRLAGSRPEERRLLQGYYAWQHGDEKLALANFTGMTNSLLASALVTHIEKTLTKTREVEAQKSFAALLTLASVTSENAEANPVLSQINQTAYTESQCTQIKAAAQRFTELYGTTAIARRMAPILSALNTVSPIVRKIDLAAVETVMSQLKAWKSGETTLLFSYRIDEGLVCLDLSENKVLPNLSILKALPFKELSFRKCAIGKLPSLEGFHITKLDLSDSSITNLSGIKDAFVEELNLSGTRVPHLRALKPLTLRTLNAGNCPNLTDLSGLTITRLTNIVLTGSGVSSLVPLEGAPLISADFSKCTLINDLKPLAQCPLEELTLAGCNRISMIYALKGLPLKKLDISGTTVSDLSSLSSMPLESLNLADAKHITDLSPLSNSQHLRTLTLPNETVNTTCLRQHKSLMTIGYPNPIVTALFWQKNP